MSEAAQVTWDVEGNPYRERLARGEGNVVSQYAGGGMYSVLTKEPLRGGGHYFKFTVHRRGDWSLFCGLAADRSAAGVNLELHLIYVHAHVVGSTGRLLEGDSELKRLPGLKRGDVSGMLGDLDLETPAVAVDLNGELQGACQVPNGPLWAMTVLGTGNRVGLQKPSLEDSPPANLEELYEALGEFGTNAAAVAPKVAALRAVFRRVLIWKCTLVLFKMLARLIRLLLEDLLNLFVQWAFLVKFWDKFGIGMRVFTLTSMAAGLICSCAGPIKDLLSTVKARRLAKEKNLDINLGSSERASADRFLASEVFQGPGGSQAAASDGVGVGLQPTRGPSASTAEDPEAPLIVSVACGSLTEEAGAPHLELVARLFPQLLGRGPATFRDCFRSFVK